MTEKKLAEIILKARSEKEVEEIIKETSDSYGVRWRAVGDMPNNSGTIGMGSEPGLAIVERVTNMFDSLLELGHDLNPGINVNNPREAACEYYGVPLSGLADMDEPNKLATKMLLSLEESGKKNHPTIIVRDKGIGETASGFPKTLLSLHQENKVDKPWTMGTYGQGGSVAYGFCEAVIIISRRHPKLLNGANDHVAWTVVKRRHDSTKKLPNYEYLVGHDNEVFSFDPKFFPNFDYGTMIIHVAYDLQIKGPFTTNPFQFFNSALFNPILPFTLTGNRGKEKNYGKRTIIGNEARLRNIKRAKGDIEVAFSDTVKLNLGPENGIANASLWVLRRPEGSTSKTDPTASYIQASHAVSMTYNGQRHDSVERYWIKKNAYLSFLFKHMIIKIDATDLTGNARANLFSSTRERGRSGTIRSQIYEALADYLCNDEDLKLLNHKEKERLLQKSTRAANAKVIKRLSKFIKHKLKEFGKSGKGHKDGTSDSPGTGDTPKKKKSGYRGKPRDLSDNHLLNDPTILKFTKGQVKIRQGSRTHIFIEINAKNRYLPNFDNLLDIRFAGPDNTKLRIVAQSSLMGGKARWVISAESDTPLGDYTLTAELTTTSRILRDSIEIKIKKAQKANDKPGSGNEPETGPEVKWVYQDNWEDHNMGPKIVGRVHEDVESTIIFVNRHYIELDKVLRGRSLTEDAINTRADRYQYPVACGLWLQEHFRKHHIPDDKQPSEDYLEAEMQRLADAVIVAVDPDVDIASEEEDFK